MATEVGRASDITLAEIADVFADERGEADGKRSAQAAMLPEASGDQGRMALSRYEARGTARGPAGVTPGHAIAILCYPRVVKQHRSMTEKSEHFERQIERIHSLLDESGAKVTWNDRIPDPDNPSQPRQIDITLRREDALTMIECRIHAATQDVQWIEELIGRRASLRANAIIGVSASGFTRGAIAKANAHGVMLRDMQSLTEQEISAWGQRTKVSVELHHFDNADLTFVFDSSARSHMTVEKIEDAFQNRRIPLASLFDMLTKEVRERDPSLAATMVQAKARPKDIAFDGMRVLAIDVTVDYWCEEKTLSLPTVVAYDIPESEALERNTYVEIIEEGKFEITQSSDRFSVVIDTSSVELPVGAKLGRFKLAFRRPVEMREFRLLGNPDLGFWLGPSVLRIAFE